jgi:protein-S-isoprenylcysteine O-methyltransferase Ste14
MPGTITSPRQIAVYVAVAALLLLADPQMPTFLAGCGLAVIGIAIRVWGCGHLRKNQEMINSGPFAHVQHPLYLGTFFVATGALLAAGSTAMPAVLLWVAVGPLFAIVFFAYYLPKKRRIEGGRLESRFGEQFADWKKSVPVFIPSVKPYPRAAPRRWNWSVFRGNHELEMDVLITVLFAAILVRHLLQAELSGG